MTPQEARALQRQAFLMRQTALKTGRKRLCWVGDYWLVAARAAALDNQAAEVLKPRKAAK